MVTYLTPCYTEQSFLVTCHATMTNKTPFKLQRGCQTFATFFATCNAYNNKQDDGNLPRAKDEPSLAHSDKIALQVAERKVTRKLHASNLSRIVAKSRGSFSVLFLQLATQQLQLQNGVLHVNFFL